jgi:hypothetical protein
VTPLETCVLVVLHIPIIISMMMNLYAISFYLLISCLTSESVNASGFCYTGPIMSSDSDDCMSVPARGKGVVNTAIELSVIYFASDCRLNLNMTYGN